ncbi:MAG: GNAT family N-acetyltransferase [Petrotogaceae bacterium]|jgi:ribosomal protein S18 acetylase RimI-like enzyme|nr:GNAT family N-acetyltransferase [Petrotogaceae bacterium]
MDRIVIKEDIIPEIEELLILYNDAEWFTYTNNSIRLKNAVENSLKVLTAWDTDELIGLIRVVGDGQTIIYIQDILILKKYQKQGIGSTLLKMILERYKSVRQVVLMTDNTEKTINFYKKNGMIKASECNCIAFMK